jgi:DNA-binding transcriptional LysR family regulator
MMDRIDEWRVLVSVASLRSFTQAARALGRSPQAVTRAVAALEERLGMRLLHRTTRSVSLTHDGERQLVRARQLLTDFEQLESGAEAGAALAGRLTITAPVLFGQLHVVPVVAELLALHPGLEARLLLYDRVVSLAEEGIDVALRIGPLPDSALRVRPVGQVRSVLCASPAYLEHAGVPRTPAALTKHACIAFSATTPNIDRWSFPRPGQREQTVAVRPRLVVNSGPAAIEAALAGVGIVRVLSYQVARLVRDKKLKLVLTGFERAAYPVQLVQLPGVQTRAVASFIDFALARLRQRLDRDG